MTNELSQQTNTHDSGEIVFNVNDTSVKARSDENGETKTELGRLRVNPFTVEIMAQAHRNLYGSSITAMRTTHLYVKFLPASFNDIKLLEAMDIFLFDFPLEYEIIEMGDYYQELEGENFPELYTVVEAGFNFPEVDYEIVDELYLDKSDPFLLAESFRITGNTSSIVPYVFPPTGLGVDALGGNQVYLDVPEQPECETGCYPVLHIDTSVTPFIYTWECECPPPPPTTEPTNACGCPVYTNSRKPAGCVKVQDTELSTPGTPSTFEKVRRVKITAWDGWFDLDYAETDDNGCWKINDAYHGNAYFWITFKNPRCRIRGVGDGVKNLWRWLTAITDYVGKLSGPVYNNISVNYNMWTSNGSDAHRYWGAATVNNALHEFHDYASQDGINIPPYGLDIMITKTKKQGYAFMPHFMGPSLTEIAIANGISGNIPIFSEFATLLVILSPTDVVSQFFPDVSIGINYNNSDRQKSLAYHEIAHTSHYTLVGANYWADLVAAEVAAGGHGNQNSDDADIIAKCESWAEFLGGHVYVHRTYNNATSLGETWLQRLEETWNENPNHIPIGLYHDLMDIGTEPTSYNQDSPYASTTVVDNVSGFTIPQMFASLAGNQSFSYNLINNYLSSTSNTQAQVTALFQSY